MAELKTKRNDGSVNAFLDSVTPAKKQADSRILLDMMREETGHEPEMWGANIVGFGSYDYKYASGRAGTWFLAGFAPRKQSLTLYIMSGFDHYDELMGQLGKFKTGKSCLYIKKIEDVDETVLRRLIRESAEHVAKTNESVLD